MFSVSTSLLAILLTVPLAPSSHASWEPEVGDRILVDTQQNAGYLIHPDGTSLSFPVVTGQRRWVRYIGRSYNATTPNRAWQAQSIDIKSDRVTFGPSGRFLRLYGDDERTAYGLHEHRDEEEMFAGTAEERFRSMGCIIVQADIMDILEETFERNGQRLAVTTQHGIEDTTQNTTALTAVMGRKNGK